MKQPSELGRGAMGEDGIWAWLADVPRRGVSRPALFLDRDGVVVDYVPYLCRPDDVALMPATAELIAAANRFGLPVVVVTNQSGVGRGYYGWDDVADVTRQMQALLEAADAFVDAVYACPFHRDAAPPYNHADHPARKPNHGMLRRAARDLGIDLEASWIVGDTADDLLAGRAAGLAGGVHVLTGLGVSTRARVAALASESYRIELTTGLRESAPVLLRNLTSRERRSVDERRAA